MFRFLPIGLAIFLTFFIFYSPIKNYQSVDTTTSCCRVEDVLNSNGSFDPNATSGIFDNQTLTFPKQLVLNTSKPPTDQTQILGLSINNDQKWIEVNLTTEQLTAYEGTNVVRQFLISSGKWSPTPTGTFTIWYKTRFQRMVGGSKELGTYYDLPNVPDNMFFDSGYALHGAYWHNNFGAPMSHGCVNEPLADAAWMFDWAGPVVPDGQNFVKAAPDNPGTKVWIHY